MSSSSMFTSSVNTVSRVKKRLFAELDNTQHNPSQLASLNKYTTPQLAQNKIEPKIPRIKETRKEKLHFRHKLMKKYAKHRIQLHNFLGNKSSKRADAQVTASTPFKVILDKKW